MLNCELGASEGLTERDLFLHEEVSALSFENRVLIHFNLNHDIAWLNPWEFIRLSTKYILFTIRGTLGYFDFDELLIFDDFVALVSK